MAELRELFERFDARNVSTYIQSGNVLFESPARDLPGFADAIEKALLAAYGLDSAVIVRSASELRSVLSSIPYPKSAHPSIHVGFFKSRPSKEEIRQLSSFEADDESVVVKDREGFLYLPNGVGRARLPTRINKLSTPVTLRNLRTVAKLEELASQSA